MFIVSYIVLLVLPIFILCYLHTLCKIATVSDCILLDFYFKLQYDCIKLCKN